LAEILFEHFFSITRAKIIFIFSNGRDGIFHRRGVPVFPESFSVHLFINFQIVEIAVPILNLEGLWLFHLWVKTFDRAPLLSLTAENLLKLIQFLFFLTQEFQLLVAVPHLVLVAQN
jgi:hypothetical protein